MILILSPSKSMDMAPCDCTGFTQPAYLDRAGKLVVKLRGFSTAELMEFMDISEPLAELNRKRYREWATPFSPANASPALFAFTGDVYEGLDAARLGHRDVQYAQQHLRILSGLYGLLRPLDLIQPYRLEMGRPLETRGAKNLYDFWRDTVTEGLNAEPGGRLVNLASQEYFKAVDTKKLNKQVVSPVFKEERNGQFRLISFFAKKARGSMARYLIQNRIDDAEGLLGFAEDGYAYNPGLSTASAPVFTRAQPQA
jgi:cytoplasmic iron level regulating protein YaaA (DUF328/UPF0246 family)